nr:hypothetical protein [Tanacetum cinerariifolium]
MERFLVKHAVAIASAHKNNDAREKINIVLGASTNVQFRRSTTPFCYGVRTEDIWRLEKNRDSFQKLYNHFWCFIFRP